MRELARELAWIVRSLLDSERLEYEGSELAPF